MLTPVRFGLSHPYHVQSYHINKEKLETKMHVEKKNETLAAEEMMDDDGYALPYSI